MHEYSIAEGMVDTITEVLGGPKKLTRVFVTIGPLAGISAEVLGFCFPEAASLAGFGKPELVINLVPARMKCEACTVEYEVEDFFSLCPGCGSLERTVLSGREFQIDSVEVEE